MNNLSGSQRLALAFASVLLESSVSPMKPN